MDIGGIPFNKALGITSDGATTVLSPSETHLNHVETIHATVLFGVAEAAAGQCLLTRFPDLVPSFVAVLRGATIKYRRPATGRSPIHGTGLLSDTDARAFMDTLQSRGRATIDITVSVSQNDTEVFTGVFTWFASRR